MTDYAAAVAQHGSVRAAAKALGVNPSTVSRKINGRRSDVRRSVPAPAAVAGVKGRSLEAFRAEFDKGTIIPTKIRAALAALGDGWLYETEFAQAAGVSLNDLGHWRDEFAAHVLIARAPGRSERRVWAGTVAAATQMRAML